MNWKMGYAASKTKHLSRGTVNHIACPAFGKNTLGTVANIRVPSVSRQNSIKL
jgi:hypothetical protein